jgi:2'-5' RNA ligase
MDHSPQSIQRLFLALPVSEQAGIALDQLPKESLSGKWLVKSDYHITLRFLGDTDPQTALKIVEKMNQIKIRPFDIHMEGLDTFNTRKNIVLWGKIVSTRKLTNLCATINDKLQALDFDMPVKPYIPHITLCRTTQPPKKVDLYIQKNGGKLSQCWHADHFCLYVSRTSPDSDQKYDIIEKFPLI